MRGNQCQNTPLLNWGGTLQLDAYWSIIGVMFCNRRHSYWRHASNLEACCIFWRHIIFLEASSAIGGMLHFWRHYYLFGGIFCNRRHAAFLEVYYLFGGILSFWRHALDLEASFELEACCIFGGMPWISRHLLQ